MMKVKSEDGGQSPLMPFLPPRRPERTRKCFGIIMGEYRAENHKKAVLSKSRGQAFMSL